MTPGPGTRDYPASETQLASAKASDLDSQPDSAPGEVTPAAKKFALSGNWLLFHVEKQYTDLVLPA